MNNLIIWTKLWWCIYLAFYGFIGCYTLHLVNNNNHMNSACSSEALKVLLYVCILRYIEINLVKLV